MLKSDIRPLHFPPIFFTPLPFLAQRRNTLCLNADHFAPPPIPHPSYKVRIGKGRNLLISDSLENDPHGEILTPHHEFKPRKSCCSCFNSPPPTPHMRIRKIGKRALKKTLILTLIIATKFAFIWRFFLLTYGAENALKNHQNKHFFCAETSTFFGAFSVPKENAKKAQIRQKSSFSYFLLSKGF